MIQGFKFLNSLYMHEMLLKTQWFSEAFTDDGILQEKVIDELESQRKD